MKSLEQNRKRVHEMECTNSTFLLDLHYQIGFLDVLYSAINILHFVA